MVPEEQIHQRSLNKQDQSNPFIESGSNLHLPSDNNHVDGTELTKLADSIEPVFTVEETELDRERTAASIVAGTTDVDVFKLVEIEILNTTEADSPGSKMCA